MTRINEIRDEYDLKNWLMFRNVSRQRCLWLASRACMRALPSIWSWAAAPSSNSSQSAFANTFLRTVLTTQIVAQRGTDAAGLAKSVEAGVQSAASAIKSSAAENFNATVYSNNTPSNAITSSLAIANLAEALTHTSPSHAVIAKTIALATKVRQQMWDSLRKDCSVIGLDQHRVLEKEPRLWHGDASSYSGKWVSLKHQLTFARRTKEHWEFWVSWYDHAMAGTEDRWDLLERIALSDSPIDSSRQELENYDVFWRGTDAEVNARINSIWEDWEDQNARRSANDDSLLAQAEKETYNAERISFNTDTHRYRVDPVSDLPKVYMQEAVEELEELADRLTDDSGSVANRYPLDKELSLLRTARNKITAPRRLHHLCRTVLCRVQAKMRSGDCPSHEDDADMADLVFTVTSVATTLIERDAEVKEAATKSDAFAEIDDTDAETFAKAAAELLEQPLTEGALTEDLTLHAATIVSPWVTAEERRETAFVLASRFLRIWRDIRLNDRITHINSALKPSVDLTTNTGKLFGVLSAPVWLPQAIQVVLRLL